MDYKKLFGTKKRVTTNDILLRKYEVLRELQGKQQLIGEYANRRFTPFLSVTEKDTHSVVRKFTTGLAVFDGALLAWRIFRRIRRLIGRR
ncbi:MAG: hypothetical protein LBM61_00240 [Prevotellaceae bacterium]|jgi:hypothetical protein|nr:hypothetical protein [Prevotellaceae bacterium]